MTHDQWAKNRAKWISLIENYVQITRISPACETYAEINLTRFTNEMAWQGAPAEPHEACRVETAPP